MANVEFTKRNALEALAKIDAVKADERLANFVAH